MKQFKFEKDLINPFIIRWVGDNPDFSLSRNVIDAHLKAQCSGTKEAEEAYEKALRELRAVSPWEVAGASARGLFIPGVGAGGRGGNGRSLILP